ncbi:hypothetical protein LG202_10660 [Methylobacillus methanolivorans]
MAIPLKNHDNSSTLTTDPSLLKIVKELLPSFPDRHVPIAREAARKRERLSSIPFYAARAAKGGDHYWVKWSLSYMGPD